MSISLVTVMPMIVAILSAILYLVVQRRVPRGRTSYSASSFTSDRPHRSAVRPDEASLMRGALLAIHDLASARLRNGPYDSHVTDDLTEIARIAADHLPPEALTTPVPTSEPETMIRGATLGEPAAMGARTQVRKP